MGHDLSDALMASRATTDNIYNYTIQMPRRS